MPADLLLLNFVSPLVVVVVAAAITQWLATRRRLAALEANDARLEARMEGQTQALRAVTDELAQLRSDIRQQTQMLIQLKE